MKILLVGAHGTGKTTLAKEIQKLYPHYDVIDGIHREAKRDGFQINQTWSWASQIETVRRYLQIVNKINDKGCFISLDSIIRQTAYAICNCLPKEVIGLMKELCYIEREHFAQAVFYIPIEFSLEKDGVRDMRLQFQKDVDMELKKLLDEIYSFNKHNTYYIITGPVQQRVKKICELSKMI